MHIKIDIKPIALLRNKRGLNDYGKVQQFIDSECIRLMEPYTPMRSGDLYKAATLGTKIGSGIIKQVMPYGRYHYRGLLMVSSITGSAWARQGEAKVYTDRPLKYDREQHKLAGPQWFERMKADKKVQILRGAKKIAGGR